MGSSIILAGLALAGVGLAGKYAVRVAPQATQKMEEAMKAMPKMDSQTWANSKYYKVIYYVQLSQMIDMRPSRQKTSPNL